MMIAPQHCVCLCICVEFFPDSVCIRFTRFRSVYSHIIGMHAINCTVSISFDLPAHVWSFAIVGDVIQSASMYLSVSRRQSTWSPGAQRSIALIVPRDEKYVEAQFNSICITINCCLCVIFRYAHKRIHSRVCAICAQLSITQMTEGRSTQSVSNVAM